MESQTNERENFAPVKLVGNPILVSQNKTVDFKQSEETSISWACRNH